MDVRKYFYIVTDCYRIPFDRMNLMNTITATPFYLLVFYVQAKLLCFQSYKALFHYMFR